MDEGWRAPVGADRVVEAPVAAERRLLQGTLRGLPFFNTAAPRWFHRAFKGVGLGFAFALAAALAPAAARTGEGAGSGAVAQDARPAQVSPQSEVQPAPGALGADAAAEAKPGEPSLHDIAAEPDPDEILEFGAMRVKRWIVETVLRAAEEIDVDPVYMMALADKESSFIPANRASTSSAEGLFQFIATTWLEMVRAYGARHGLEEEAGAIVKVKGKLIIEDEDMRERVMDLRRDPYLSALMAGEMMKRDRARIERRIGRTISRSEFYLAHFLGAGSAGKMMALMDDKPDHSAPKAFPAAAKANKSLFYAKDGRKTRNLSVAEVYEKIDGMIDARIDRYRDVEAKVGEAKVADAGP